MIQSPGLMLTMLAFVLVIGPLVFIHELGHYLAGRVFGIRAETFAIGFGRELAGWTDRRGTRWKVGWLPLGGYVKFAGDMNAVSQPSAEWLALPHRFRLERRVALLILAGFAVVYGDPRTPTVIATAVPGGPAARAGLVAGDRITAIGGREVNSFDQVAEFVRLRPNEQVPIDYVRKGRPSRTTLTLAQTVEHDRFGRTFRLGQLGVMSGTPVYAPVSPAEAPGVAVRRTGELLRSMIDGIGQIVTGRRSVKELGGPISIAKVSGERFTLGPAEFVFLIALVSINLGFINLLPVPMLDGGHLMFYAIEAVRRKPVGPEAQEWAYRGGFAAVVALMLVVTFNDLGNLGIWRGLAGLVGAAG